MKIPPYLSVSLTDGPPRDWTNFSLKERLHQLEAHYIRMALEDSGGVIPRAARMLRLPRHQNLYYMLKHLHKDLRSVLAAVIASGRGPNLDEDLIKKFDEAASQQTPEIRLFHIEDDPTVAAIVQETVQRIGWESKPCADGKAALEELAGGVEYDLLLVDDELPGLNGLALIEQVRSMFHRRHMPIIILSATLDEGVAADAGVDAFLRKSKDFPLIVETIDRLFDPIVEF